MNQTNTTAIKSSETPRNQEMYLGSSLDQIDIKKTKLRAKLDHIKRFMHATAIQAIWRGKVARKLAQRTKNISSPSSLQNRLIPTHTSERMPLLIESYPSIARFPNQTHEIMCYVDCGINFPLNCTATRIVARIMDEKYSEVDKNIYRAISDMDSDATHPIYNLEATWKVDRGNTSTGVITVVLRIDTLERPSLSYKCFGYAFLQVNRLNASLSSTLNYGRFLLPIFYGNIPLNESLDENLTNKMNLVPKTYLCVRLSPNNSSNSNPSVNPMKIITPVDAIALSRKATTLTIPYYGINKDGTCASEILQSLCYATSHHLPRLELDSAMIKYKRGMVGIEDITALERKQVIDNITKWISIAFPIVNPTKYISKSFMYPYNDEKGLRIGLDSLYNMPTRPIPLVGYDAKVSHKLQLFKTYSRCLKGVHNNNNNNSANNNKNSNRNNNVLSTNGTNCVGLVYQDISKDIDISSTELSPRYHDDPIIYDRCNLSSSACLLIRVIAIDVYIYGGVNSRSRSNSIPTDPVRSNLFNTYDNYNSLQNSHASITQASLEAAVNSNINNNTNSDGLATQKPQPRISVYRDTSQNWWTILPLMQDSIFQREIGSMPVFSSTDKISDISTLHSFYSNSGTHIIPLLEGVPPKHILSAPNPFYQLMQDINQSFFQIMRQSSRLWNVFPSISSSSSSSNSPDKLQTSNTLKFSNGASAIIRIIDGNLPELGNPHLSSNLSILPSTTSSDSLFRATSEQLGQSLDSHHFRPGTRNRPGTLNKYEVFKKQFAYSTTSNQSTHNNINNNNNNNSSSDRTTQEHGMYNTLEESCSLHVDTKVLVTKINDLCLGLVITDDN